MKAEAAPSIIQMLLRTEKQPLTGKGLSYLFLKEIHTKFRSWQAEG